MMQTREDFRVSTKQKKSYVKRKQDEFKKTVSEISTIRFYFATTDLNGLGTALRVELDKFRLWSILFKARCQACKIVEQTFLHDVPPTSE